MMLSKPITVFAAAAAVIAGVDCVVTSNQPSSPQVRLLDECIEYDPNNPNDEPHVGSGLECALAAKHGADAAEWLIEHGWRPHRSPPLLNPDIPRPITPGSIVDDLHIGELP